MRRSLHQFLIVAVASLGLGAMPFQRVMAAAPDELLGYAVGSLPGQLSVDQGAANYSIPIGVPPGVAGVEPELALSYSSQAGTGFMGKGFSLSGLSAITRCGRNRERDGSRVGIEWKKSDRYCLDGQRLILKSGVYGEAGSEYRTELDGFARIIAHSEAGEGPAWFSVETKAGQTLEYGNTADSRIEANGRNEAFAWAQNKVIDAVGNQLSVVYHEATTHTEFYPKLITYGGNSVVFLYETLPATESDPSYLSSVKFRSTVQLTDIVIRSGEDEVSTVKLGYNKRSYKDDLLETVQICAGQECQAPTRFTWGGPEEAAPQYEAGRVWLQSGYPTEVAWSEYGSFRLPLRSYIADINRDGFHDVYVIQKSSQTNYALKIYLSDGNTLKEHYSTTACGGCVYAVGDVDGDERPDIVRGDGSSLYVAKGLANGFGSFTLWNSGGLPTRSVVVESFFYPYQTTAQWPLPIELVDVDGYPFTPPPTSRPLLPAV